MTDVGTIPEPLGTPGTVAGLLSTHASGPAMITTEGEILDHVGLVREVDRLANRLREAGLGPADRIAVALPNGPEMALVLLAVMSVGCVAPLNPNYREEEFRFYLEDLGARAMITLPGQPQAAYAARPEQTTSIELLGSALSIDFAGPSGNVAAASGRDGSTGRPGPDDHALVLHTSGTTSRPKIVPLRHRNLVASAKNIAGSLALTSADRSLIVMPLFHIHGIMSGLLAPLSVGASVIPTPGFDAFAFHRWVEELKPTYYSAVPTMHQMVLARAREPRPTTLRFVRSSSASLPPPVFESLHRLFDVPVIEAYGMTEASHQMAGNPFDRQKVGSVGLPTGIEITILDTESNAVLPPGTRGEVAIKGPTVVDGYENNPTANEAAFTDGWFRTGDEGRLDEEGYLFLTGRLKELINRGGEKISPLEIDAVLLEHPAVAQAVAFAMPHPMLGEEVAAAVVLREDSEEAGKVDERELRAHVSGRLAAFKVPKRILFVLEIPKGPTGKVQRIGLAERLGVSA